MQIRPYQPADRDRLLDIWLEASRVGHAFLGEATLREQQALVRDTYLPLADNWVAEIDGRVEAFIGLLDGFIGGLFVDPQAHGSGLGRALVDHAGARLGPLTVSVYADNGQALAFYRRCGFVETTRKAQDDEGRPLAVVDMRRDPGADAFRQKP
ncbi:GNAT family N-acetyltransferase [Phreatobacter stygius]|uniref:GNAT family N-acetyltransferase n=1 Tax=Phreatobacter stygius TaxID=1940610 RepID=A0A4D7B044_9HYPH|nr:GNAT family N-acetyltransferase [Phreatobacter stygius]QCI63390.1 GNAT family N-acetyltransferase [Phreatobacter stygius]